MAHAVKRALGLHHLGFSTNDTHHRHRRWPRRPQPTPPPAAIARFTDTFHVDITVIMRLGGPARARIATRLGDGVRTDEESHGACWAPDARLACSLEGDAVIGVEYEVSGKSCRGKGQYALATSGYAADSSPTGLLARHRPDVLASRRQTTTTPPATACASRPARPCAILRRCRFVGPAHSGVSKTLLERYLDAAAFAEDTEILFDIILSTFTSYGKAFETVETTESYTPFGPLFVAIITPVVDYTMGPSPSTPLRASSPPSRTRVTPTLTRMMS
ncbi:hypothetical protein C8R45DRAFT_1214664, partial [Mycena sanguinolenta]